VLKLRAQQRLQPLLNSGGYQYEPEVEEFLRRSPSVRRDAAFDAEPSSSQGRTTVREAPRSTSPGAYDSLTAEEVIGVAASLDGQALTTLRRHEAATRSRPEVLAALDVMLDRARDSS
jgi:hypothetical protein